MGSTELSPQMEMLVLMNKIAEIKSPNNPFLRGNFAPVDEEMDIDCGEIIGEIPKELAGAFLRIGSNPVFVADIEKYHWFDGDGMIHKVHFDDGKATYHNRYVQTKGLGLELEKGQALWKGLNSPPDLANEHGLFKNAANTAMVFHNNKLLALWEGGTPTEIKLTELETVGEVDFDGDLKRAFTAHPKVDVETGEMISFGYNMMIEPYLSYYVINKNGTMTTNVDIALPKGVMMHDCAITKNYTLFLDFPVTGDLEEAMKGGPAISWDPGNGARIGVIPRHGKADDVHWFDVCISFAFHTVNAYERGDEIIMEGCRSPKTNVIGAASETESDAGDTPYLYQWRLSMKTGEVTESFIDHEHGCEFPRINDNYAGLQHRFAYCSRIPKKPTDGVMFDGLIKYDRANDTAEHIEFGTGRSGGEAIFAPRPGGTDEDDGWIIGFVWDGNTRRSECFVVDAKNFGGGAVARVIIPARVPYGFHASWVSAEDIASQA